MSFQVYWMKKAPVSPATGGSARKMKPTPSWNIPARGWVPLPNILSLVCRAYVIPSTWIGSWPQPGMPPRLGYRVADVVRIRIVIAGGI